MGFGPPWWAARLAPGPRRLRSGAWRRIPSPAPAAGAPRTARPTSPKAPAPPAKTGRAAVPRPASSTRSCRRERRSWRGGPASSMAIGTAMSARTAPPAITTTATATPGATQSTSASTAPAPSRTTRRSKAPRREPTFCPVNTHGATAVRRRHRSSAHREHMSRQAAEVTQSFGPELRGVVKVSGIASRTPPSSSSRPGAPPTGLAPQCGGPDDESSPGR
jgi:hypothetical protein